MLQLSVLDWLTGVVAAGFDAARGDQLGGCFVTPECYAHMTHMLMSVAGGKLVACLEVCIEFAISYRVAQFSLGWLQSRFDFAVRSSCGQNING